MRLTLITLLALTLIPFTAHAGRDADMTCEEISAEIAQLNEIVTAAGGAETTNAVTGAATGAAVNGAIWAGAGSSVPFLGGIANIASAVTSNSAERAKEDAEDAEKRLQKLAGISEVKGCE